MDDFRQAGLGAPDAALLEYADKLTRAPSTVAQPDVARLTAVGFSDRAILDIVLVVGYYAFVNRLAQGLGVPLEAFWSSEDGAR